MPSIEWKPESASSVTLQKQIEGHIRGKILNGEWPIGTKIPSQRALAKSLGVNRSTVSAALAELAADGLTDGRSGAGTMVVNNTWSILAAAPPPDWRHYVTSGAQEPNLTTIQDINRAEFHPGVIRLGTGELSPDLLPSSAIRDLFRQIPERPLRLGYEEGKGSAFLREQVSNHVKTLGIHASPASILIVSGALQALQLIAIGLLQQNSTILLEKPSYLYSVPVFQSAGMRLIGLSMDADGVQVPFIEKFKRQHNAAMLYTIPTFHNPTGTCMTKERRTEFMDVCTATRLPVVEDDVYRDLWLDAPPPPPLKSTDGKGIVLYLGSMSKTLSPGLRIGWIIGPEPVIERLADIKMQTDYGASSLSQWAVAEFLAGGLYHKHVENVRSELRIRRALMLQALSVSMGDIATWNTPGGGFYVWLRLHRPLSMKKLFDRCLSEGILINPGNIYDRSTDQHLRLSYAHAPANAIAAAIERLSVECRRGP